MAELAETLGELRASGWESRTVKEEIRANAIGRISNSEPLFDGVMGYEETVVPQMEHAILAGHDIVLLGERGQAKTRMIRSLTGLLDEWMPIVAGSEINDDPYNPVSRHALDAVAEHGDATPIAWVHRDARFGEKLATPDTSIADLIGEVDPIKVAEGRYLSDELTLHYGLVPRTNRGVFAINELPDLAERIQVGLLNVLEERDVQIRGFPVRFDVDVLILFSANPSTYNRSGKVIPQLKDRIGSLIQTHYPIDRDAGIEIMEQEANVDLDGDFPVRIPYFMKEICEQITVQARKSKYVDHQSGVSARFSLANYRTMIASARQRGIVHGEKPAVPRISDLAHLYTSSLGKLELYLMGSHQMSEKNVLDSIVAEAIQVVFSEYVSEHGLEEIAEIFGKGVRIEVGDMIPSSQYAERLKRVPPAWEKAFEVNASSDEAVRASCVEFILAGLYAMDKISRGQDHGHSSYEI